MSEKKIVTIPLDRIICGKQVREHFDEEELIGLTQSLRESGQHEPIHVMPLAGDRYSLLTGGRRVRAAKKAGWTSVEAIVEHVDLSKGDVAIRQLIENMQRIDLSPLEKAKGIELAKMETGLNGTQIASRLGFQNGTVTKLLSLLTLPGELQEKVHSGELPATSAYELARVEDAAEQSKLAGRVISGELNRDGLIGEIKQTKRTPERRKKRKTKPSRVVAKMEDRQSITVSSSHSLDLNAFIAVLEKLMSFALAARTEGLTLAAFLKRLPNQQQSVPEPAQATDSSPQAA